ncbi:tripartite tricarboxylate transporter TctB family protein [Xenophilus arseniciresistens]|uniref:Tripartite tricarboxylate transporter TctB family protein n=1 Tax=Xenophilus arseniciresistens TaxID=1283306 RepID=A0AAE3SYI5_9BURK|nr:tripartite tricarboxylate transporter TctB family protein [Xenophilus arseniciresistens]MDA7416074.1 tripartite tricarboxylate transporter TctB family protein [Xenophilus arseniciresistens]
MSSPIGAQAQSAEQGGADEAAHPRSDFKDAIGWMLLGVVTLVGALRMDRLESQDINPYTVPGLLPGLLGIGLMLLGALMAVRSLRRGALTAALPAASPLLAQQRRRVAVAIAMCVGYSVVLVGHGLPFWLASAVYISASILIFQRMSQEPAERRLDLRSGLKALVIGVGMSVIVWLVFEQVFLVRLP